MRFPALAALLAVAALPARAGMVETPSKSEAELTADLVRALGERSDRLRALLGDGTAEGLHAGNVLTTIQLVLLGLLVLSGLILLIAIIGYSASKGDDKPGDGDSHFDSIP